MNNNEGFDKGDDTLPQNNEQIYIAIEKYLQLISLEFKEHLDKYKRLYSNVI
jgi:hypothetical protein